MKHQTPQAWRTALLLLLAVVWLSPRLALAQQTFDVTTPGMLPTLIGETAKNEITSLKVTGRIDGTDILFIREMAGRDYQGYTTNGQLQTLDLSDATIVSGGDAYYYSGENCVTEDNVVGRLMFYDLDKLTTLILPNSARRIGEYGIYGNGSLATLQIGTGITQIDRYGITSNYQLKTLVIPNQVTELGEYALCYNSQLESVTLSTNITTLPSGCFDYCYNLSSINLPSGLTSIGENAFQYCRALTTLSIPSTVSQIGPRAFYDTGLTEITLPDGITELGEELFYSCGSLAAVHLPSTLLTIGADAFLGCRALSSIQIPTSVTSIGRRAFYGSALTEIVLPQGITRIEYETFRECSSLTSVRLPNGLTEIESQAFYYCTALQSIELPASLTAIGSTCFAYSGLTSIVLPDAVTTVPSSAFYGCSNLATATLGSATTQIGDHAFAGTAITGLQFPATLTQIDYGAFAGCAQLQEFTIPRSVTSAGSNIFDGCTNLQRVTLEWQLDYLPSSLFYNCPQLTSVAIPEGLREIQGSAFYGCSALADFQIPATVESIGWSAFSGCTSLTSTTIPNGVSVIESNTFSGCTSLSSVTLHENVKAINSDAFSGCQSLSQISLPDNLEVLGSSAFSGCSSLASIVVPSAITTLYSHTFRNCTTLKTVTLPNGLTRIDDSAFEGCEALAQVSLPETLAEIGYWAFARTGLVAITLPANITRIGSYAFWECASLREIHAQPTTPPTLSWGTFDDNTYANAMLYVPDGTLSAYKNAEYWMNFTNASEEAGASDNTPLTIEEWAALKEFHAKADGSNWLNGWEFGDTPATTSALYGVTNRNGHVVRISLHGNQLSGTLNTSLLALPELAELDLGDNQLKADINEQLGAAATALGNIGAKLTYLDISGNPISGNVGILGQLLPQLTTLRADHCHFSEVVPVLPEQITTLTLDHQTVDGVFNYDSLIAAGPLSQRIPSIFTYAANGRYHESTVYLQLTDSLENYTWHIYTSLNADGAWRDDYSYNNSVYRHPSGGIIYAQSNNNSTGHVMAVKYDFKQGDADMSGAIDVADLQLTINKALDRTSKPFNHTAANLMADDDIINVQDVVCLVNLLLDSDLPTAAARQRSHKASAPTQGATALYVEDGLLVLESDTPVAAIDVLLNADEANWLLNDPTILHTLQQKDGRQHLVIYSLQGSTLPTGRTVLCRAVNGQVLSATMADAEARLLTPVLHKGTTAITDLSTDVEVRVEGHQLMVETARRLTNVQWSVLSLSGQLMAQGTLSELPAGTTTLDVRISSPVVVRLNSREAHLIKKITLTK